MKKEKSMLLNTGVPVDLKALIRKADSVDISHRIAEVIIKKSEEIAYKKGLQKVLP